ncbi:universal stress protein [Sphingobacteriaceae bacterium WQ 2009]|uniref:Universal stress protein n=1 Tax=Rhinopithecimicrobium faecis TaxID=2820698 RepID=A0A8T4H964_9SPHI|nr:universal stress protein [Sphingobacteriaceae bacterium WQ 2009]
MNQLLVPTDFSDNAYVAASYACQLAEKSQSTIHLLNVQTLHTNSFANVDAALDDPLFVAAKATMSSLQSKLSAEFPGVTIKTLFRHGVLSEQIAEQTKKESYTNIVMGTKGSSGLESILLGSNTYEVIMESETPVLAIPAKATRLKTDNIALLCNFRPGELEVVKQAVAIYGNNFHLKLIHINSANTEMAALDKQFKDWIDQIIASTNLDDISYTIKDITYFANAKESIFQGIQTILRDEDVDVILVTKSRKTFFNKIFSENIVKSLAYDISIPNLFAKVK